MTAVAVVVEVAVVVVGGINISRKPQRAQRHVRHGDVQCLTGMGTRIAAAEGQRLGYGWMAPAFTDCVAARR